MSHYTALHEAPREARDTSGKRAIKGALAATLLLSGIVGFGGVIQTVRTGEIPALDKLHDLIGGPTVRAATDERVDEATREKLRDATIVLFKENKLGNGDDLTRFCTGTKIENENDGMIYVLTAAHCFGENSAKQTKGTLTPQVTNIIKKSPYTYYIADPTPQSGNSIPELIGSVTGIATSTSSDWAVLAVEPRKDAVYLYDEVKSLPIDEYTTLTGRTPIVGENVAQASLPAEATALRERTNKYLGRFVSKDPGYPGVFDMVGADELHDSACSPGGSGSQAISESGAITGPLSNGAQPHNERQAAAYGINNGIAADTSKYVIFCNYSVLNQASDFARYQDALS